VQIGTPEELYSNPADLFTASFIGHPKINLIETPAKDGVMDPFRPSGIKMSSVLPTVGLRPEAIRIEDDGFFNAVVKECEYFGDQYILKIEYNTVDLTVSKVTEPIAPGSAVHFSFNQSDLLFFDRSTGTRIRV
jgi:ABC-type sugar transport system ATPase subunit